jgi:hypothetical protein
MLPKQQEHIKPTKHTSYSYPPIELCTISDGTRTSLNAPGSETTVKQEEQDSDKQLISNG